MHQSVARFLVLGGLTMALGVALGAVGSHILTGKLDARALRLFDLALRYHLLHGLGFFGVALATGRFPHTWVRLAGWLLLLGTVLFCGSLYLMAFTGSSAPAVVTPFGGLSLIVGWLMLALGVLRASRASSDA